MKKLRVVGLMLGTFLAAGTFVRAEDTMDKIKDDSHSAAQAVDSSAHTAKRKVTHHVRKAKTDIKNSNDDNSIRKAGRRANDTGNDALDKVDDTVHGH